MTEPPPADRPIALDPDDVPDRVGFEQLLTSLAALLVEGPSSQLDRNIERLLARLGAFMGIDRCAVIQFTGEGGRACITHVWTPPHFPADETIGDPRIDLRFPWLAATLKRRAPVIVERIADLPAEASAEKAHAQRLGLRSFIMVPMVGGDDVIGAIALDAVTAHRRWPASYLHRLELIGTIIANALLRQRAEVESLRHLAQLAHATRVTLVGEMAASIAHQLKQPLTAIMTNARAGLRMIDRPEAAPGPEIAAILRDVIDDGARATDIIDQVRAFLKTGEPNLAPIDLNRVVDEIVGMIASEAAAEGVTIRCELDPTLPPVLAGANAIRQVVLNLLVNGLQAMATTPREERSLVVGSSRESDRLARVTVEDRGIGVDPADTERVFEAFFTTKPNGMGMGLAVCRSIIVAHGGRLWVGSSEEGGATFHFTLPFAEAPR